jgi:hypothetical protein
MKKIKFTHFEDTNGKKTNSIQIYVGNLNLNEFMDDVEVQMNIVDGEVQFTILNQHYYDKNELKEIKAELEKIDWDHGYEFFDFRDIQSNVTYILKGKRNSDTFNQINTTKNQKKINDFLTHFKKKNRNI